MIVRLNALIFCDLFGLLGVIWYKTNDIEIVLPVTF